MQELVSVNSVISKPEEAKISVYDRGFLFGDAIYEVTRSYGKVFFTIEEHIARLRRSAEAINLDLGKSDQKIIEEMYALAKEGGEEDVYIRLQVSRGNCAFQQVSIKPKNTSAANYVMYLHKLKNWEPKYYEKGISLGVAETLRNNKKAMDPNIKSGNYLNNILGLLETEGQYDDCILLTKEGLVAEGSTFNVFMVKDKTVYTQPDDFDILQGITRKIILELCESNQIKLQKKAFSIEELLQADEVFVSSSTKEVMPVLKIGKQNFQEGGGEITKRLASLYKDYVIKYCEKAAKDHPIDF
ncbi:MAG: aminotransferase class IV [Bdellovibrionota bacterium]|nr:aminotransferase class IV [Bdellovibrionota bacterium]